MNCWNLSAKFIVSMRDPRDQITSDLEVGLRQSGNTSAVGRDIAAYAETINTYYRPILVASCKLPERFLFIRYEDLVLNFRETLDIMNAFTGMAANQFDPESDWPRLAIDPAAFAGLPSWSPFYGRALQSSRIRRYQTADEIRRIEEQCGFLMERFGYSLDRD